MNQHATQHCMESVELMPAPVTVEFMPDGRRVLVTSLLRFVEAPREQISCPDSTRA